MQFRFLILFFGFLWLNPSNTALFGQSADSLELAAEPLSRASWVVLPLIFYTPETSWGFGAAGLYAFRFQGEKPTTRPSQFQLGFAYTLRNQVLTYLPFQLFFKAEKYKVYGELGYYRYIYDYSGIGNAIDPTQKESYRAHFPRLRFNALYGLNREFYVGLRYWMDDFITIIVDDDDLLTDSTIPGAKGGFLSGLGLVANYDSRDNIFYPSKGIFAELVFFRNAKSLGSDFDFSKIYLDGSLFISNRHKHVFGLNLYGEFSWGNVPFNQLSLLGGPKRMRGYYEGNFRDKHLLILQGEYRMPLFWRFGLVAFAGLGGVADQFSHFELSNFVFTGGGGVRFRLDRKEKINLRLDAGFGRNTSGYYLTFTEAF